MKESDFDAGEALDEDAGKQKGSFGSLRASVFDRFLSLDLFVTPMLILFDSIKEGSR